MKGESLDDTLAAYRDEIARISGKVKSGNELTESERGFVCCILEDCAESTFNTAFFYLQQHVDRTRRRT